MDRESASLRLPRRPRLIVFDLDGTLVDSSTDLVQAVNHTRGTYGLAALPTPQVRAEIGHGLDHLLLGCFPGEYQAQLGDLRTRFLDYYVDHCDDNTRPYPGAMELLDTLRDRKLAVLTNKMHAPALVVLRKLNLERYFEQIIGGDSLPTMKPDPSGLKKIMREAQVEPHDTVMIGDSAPDIEVARHAGCMSIGLLNGIGQAADVLSEEPTVAVQQISDCAALLS